MPTPIAYTLCQQVDLFDLKVFMSSVSQLAVDLAY